MSINLMNRQIKHLADTHLADGRLSIVINSMSFLSHEDLHHLPLYSAPTIRCNILEKSIFCWKAVEYFPSISLNLKCLKKTSCIGFSH